MHLDVLDLRNFYYRTGLGRAAQKAIRNQMLDLWPEARGRRWWASALPCRCCGPIWQGAAGDRADAGPAGGDALAGRDAQRLGAVRGNALAACPTVWSTGWCCCTGWRPRKTRRRCSRRWGACWPTGRALFIVPNRRGLWARRDGTPFGYGRPYSLGQIEAQLARHDFSPNGTSRRCSRRPRRGGSGCARAIFWERLGRRVSAYRAGGVLMVEASKRCKPSLRPGCASRAPAAAGARGAAGARCR
jgi:hypothetical protein